MKITKLGIQVPILEWQTPILESDNHCKITKLGIQIPISK